MCFQAKQERNGIFIEEKFYKVWISLIHGLGIKRYLNLLKAFKTNKGIFNATKEKLLQVDLIDEKLCNNILNMEIRKSVKNYLKYMEINNDEYPTNLKQIYSPPISIYIKGNKDILKNTNIGMIGCRECSNYGKQVAQKISYDLAKCKINIVSGLAKGIDSYSHLGAIYAKGYTIAVLGSGLDEIYPSENKYLVDKIIRTNGAVISEYPVGTKASKINFPARNRIISGLCKGVVVVEAKKKSGTLITVDFALEQGKDVFVIPRKYWFYKFWRNKWPYKARCKISYKLYGYIRRNNVIKF